MSISLSPTMGTLCTYAEAAGIQDAPFVRGNGSGKKMDVEIDDRRRRSGYVPFTFPTCYYIIVCIYALIGALAWSSLTAQKSV